MRPIGSAAGVSQSAAERVPNRVRIEAGWVFVGLCGAPRSTACPRRPLTELMRATPRARGSNPSRRPESVTVRIECIASVWVRQPERAGFVEVPEAPQSLLEASPVGISSCTRHDAPQSKMQEAE